MKLGIIIGTRPEIIKTSPIIRECQRQKIDYFVLHTGQHFSYEMDQRFYEELELPQPKYNLRVGKAASRDQVRIMITRIGEVLSEEKPVYALVLGDTNTTLAGSLAANRLGIKIVHLEGGLRSFDIVMAEEVNRMIADYLAVLTFVPTLIARDNLLKEGALESKIMYSGNTIVDAVNQNLEIANKKADVAQRFKLHEKEFCLITLHRAENVDIKERLEKILRSLELAAKRLRIPFVFPMHPRTRKMIEHFELSMPKRISVIEPVSFLEFLQLESKARIILTDSGGVQEEACILQVPCVTLRDNTERPETVEIGANTLFTSESDDLGACIETMLQASAAWQNPYGDGTSAKKILSSLNEYHKTRKSRG